ncbi:MAG: leucine-rich repeat protein, partial [Clostridiales bacterium]|nr:leucine-rich repeat protein [Clostridiales bacterium]
VFSKCSCLTSIELLSSVTHIGCYAFEGCNSLTVYCEAESQPSGWSSIWNSSDCPVVWGYKG